MSESRIYFSRSDIEALIAVDAGVASYEIEWADNHSAVIVLSDQNSVVGSMDGRLVRESRFKPIESGNG